MAKIVINDTDLELLKLADEADTNGKVLASAYLAGLKAGVEIASQADKKETA